MWTCTPGHEGRVSRVREETGRRPRERAGWRMSPSEAGKATEPGNTSGARLRKASGAIRKIRVTVGVDQR